MCLFTVKMILPIKVALCLGFKLPEVSENNQTKLLEKSTKCPLKSTPRLLVVTLMWRKFRISLNLYEWFDYFWQGHLEGESEGFIKGWKNFIKFEKIFFYLYKTDTKFVLLGRYAQPTKPGEFFIVKIKAGLVPAFDLTKVFKVVREPQGEIN